MTGVAGRSPLSAGTIRSSSALAIPMPLRSAGNPLAIQWKLLIYSSIAWLSILLITITAFVIALEKQDRKLDLLLERTRPSLKQK